MRQNLGTYQPAGLRPIQRRLLRHWGMLLLALLSLSSLAFF